MFLVIVAATLIIINSVFDGIVTAGQPREVPPLGAADHRTDHGTLTELREDINVAIQHYRQARVADPNDVRLNERLLAAEEEYRTEAHLSRVYTTHFVVAYPRSISGREANRIADRLEQVYQAVGRRFASFPDHGFTVVLYPPPQFHAATLSPAWARGLYDGKIRLLIDSQAPPPDQLLIHEYVHAVVDYLGAGRVPAWLSEGLALYCDGTEKSSASGITASSVEYLPLTMLHRADLVALPARSARSAYWESFEATRALLARYGFIRVRQLLERISRTPDFASAFEAVLGERYLEFERRWIADQERQGF